VSTSIQAHQRPSAPPQVLAALGFMGVSFSVAALRSALVQDWARPIPAALSVFVLASLCGLWLYGLWRRLNWLRWVTVFLGASGCLLAWKSLAQLHDPTQIALYWLQFALTVPTVVLFVLPPSQRWYTHDLAA
jgi:hypothetical protein